jgi:hypothetical protein
MNFMKRLHTGNRRFHGVFVAWMVGATASTLAAGAPTITYKPYVEPGDASRLGDRDQLVIAWQTDEAMPGPGAFTVDFGRSRDYGRMATVSGRVVDNYLAADPALPVPPTAPGPRVNYTAVLGDLDFDTAYYYRVSGPGLPAGGFTASFKTRTRSERFSFLVQGDEGFFPAVPNSSPARIADYEARIVHLMFNAHRVSLAGEPPRPEPNFALNTGDNVYTFGAEASYRDFWMPVWNSDSDSNETGAPFIRSKPFYIVVGNHDIGGNGDRVNLLASDTAARYSGNAEGGDLLAYFNNYYFPLNGPTGVDPYEIFNGDLSSPTGSFFHFNGKDYLSPGAAEALRASTAVDSGHGVIRQIDHMSNYSFDQGNAHFLFLDANPHLFDALVPGSATYAAPPAGFPSYPSILREWIIHDLDSSNQTWKVVVFHQPTFSSGNATVRNNQMRAIVKVLEDHGVNIVFNGHEHNYQRTQPLRALDGVAAAPSTLGPPVVAIDASYDGVSRTVPDGVLYIVEGAGGNRDFDGNLGAPRGSGVGVDEEDSATGTFSFGPGLTFANGPASWLDTHLTNGEMTPFFGDAGSGPKITARFKAKIFSFGHVVVDGNRLTLYQITEPLLATSSATPSNPAPFGTDVHGAPLPDAIPDTLVDPATGAVVTPPADGPSALLDKFTIVKPEVDDHVRVRLSASDAPAGEGRITYTVDIDNRSQYPLNGSQVVLQLPEGTALADATTDTRTVVDEQVVVTLGRIDVAQVKQVIIHVARDSHRAERVDREGGDQEEGGLRAVAFLRSSTAQPVVSNRVITGRDSEAR